MHWKAIFDLGWAPMAVLLGARVLVFAAPLTILAEGWILWRFLSPMRTYPFWHPLKDAAVMNLVL